MYMFGISKFLTRARMPTISGGARYVISLIMIGQGILRLFNLDTIAIQYASPSVLGMLQVVGGILFLLSAFNGWRRGWFGRIVAATCAAINMLIAFAIAPDFPFVWTKLVLVLFCVLEAAQNEPNC